MLCQIGVFLCLALAGCRAQEFVPGDCHTPPGVPPEAVPAAYTAALAEMLVGQNNQLTKRERRFNERLAADRQALHEQLQAEWVAWEAEAQAAAAAEQARHQAESQTLAQNDANPDAGGVLAEQHRAQTQHRLESTAQAREALRASHNARTQAFLQQSELNNAANLAEVRTRHQKELEALAKAHGVKGTGDASPDASPDAVYGAAQWQEGRRPAPRYADLKAAEEEEQRKAADEAAKAQAAQRAAEKDPYALLQVSRDASQGEIRKAYRALSLRYHPDRNPNDDGTIAALYAAINAAHAILGDPDKRAAFDDFGDDAEQGFETLWEFQQSKKSATKDFYTGDRLIHSLTDANWDTRIRGKGVWLVEFYAPWCTHCIKSTAQWKQAADRLDGEIEFGAVNGVNNRAVMGRFNIHAYPSIILFAPEWDVQAQFNYRGPDNLPEELPVWARGMLADWQALFANTRVLRVDAPALASELAASESMWVVLFTTAACSACGDAKPNFFRLSRELAGIAQVATVDCAGQDAVCGGYGVPEANFPHLMVFPSGPKPESVKGDILYSAKEQESHLVMPLMAKLLRAATAAQRLASEVGVPANDPLGDFEKEKEDPPPPPPPPPPKENYHAPPPKHNHPQLPPGDRNRHARIGRA